MITPLFEVSQDDEFIVLVIKVPYMKASTFDYYIIGCEFKFYAKPYFLRLTFPRPLDEEGGRERLAYDISNGVLTVHLPKAVRGQFFENLGMLTQLLAKPRKKDFSAGAPVQVLSSSSSSSSTGTEMTPAQCSTVWFIYLLFLQVNCCNYTDTNCLSHRGGGREAATRGGGIP